MRIFIALLLFPLLTFGNMAQPWVNGSEHSTLYGAENCRVIKENIFIRLAPSDDIYFAKYKIKYTIHSNIDQTIPLLFIGIGLSERKFVLVNNEGSRIKDYNPVNKSKISYAKNDNITVNEEDLIYFEAKLHKGENTVYIEYDAHLEYNTYGFIRAYKLDYSLYPSKFWKSFGPINVELVLDDHLEIINSNIGEPTIDNNVSKWEIKQINTENIALEISKKRTVISDVLLYVQPLGISILSLIVLFSFHLKLIEKKHQHQNRKYKMALYLGILIVPILFYAIYFASYNLIDFSLGQKNQQHGYPLFILTAPVLMLFYGIIMYVIDRRLKSKYEKMSSQ